MANVEKINDTTLRIHLNVEDAVTMIREAADNLPYYAQDVATIYEKMPLFDYVYFCFYAYNSAKLFEFVLGMNPKEYQSFSLDAPNDFFYTLYGGMAALYEEAKKLAEKPAAV